MHPETPPVPPAQRPLASLRLRALLAVPLLTAIVVLGFEWALGGFETLADGLTRSVLLVVALSAALLLFIESLMLLPLRRLAAGWEAMESSASPPPPDLSPSRGLAAELDRLGRAMLRAHGSRWQHGQQARELQTQLAQQRELLDQAQARLATQQRELASLVRVDALTGIANTRAFDEALRREFKRAQRQRGLLAVAVLDLDDFKQFNLTHGTEVGDQALQRMAALLAARFQRDTDLVARLGGEEFVALLPGVGMAEAQGVLETLRDELRALRLPDGRCEQPLTVSVGLAAASPAHPYLSPQALLQAADEALYIAKHAGRDRLSLAS